MMDWQPIETAPKTGARILTVRGNGYVAVMRWVGGPPEFDWIDDSGRFPESPARMWMPLPVAP